MSNSPKHHWFTKKRTSRISIGIASSGLEDAYHNPFLRGAIEAAKEHDINLVVFTGEALESSFGVNSSNIIYDLITDSTIDVLVIGSSGMGGSTEALITFSERYAVPKISIGIELPYTQNILVNNTSGMRQAIQHLIEVHHYRRIAFIRGPEDHAEGNQRFQVYLDTLKESGISYDPQLVLPGDFRAKGGQEAIRILLDERKASVDAIVAANDGMALAALAELQKRHIAVPEQIALVGFDYIEDTRAVIPSLTTVRQPIYEQGKLGVELALALLRGETPINPLVLDTELVIQQSCGCGTPITLDLQSNDIPIKMSADKAIAELKSIDIAVLMSEMSISRNRHLLQSLYKAFLEDLESNSSHKFVSRFIARLDMMTHELLRDSEQITAWREALILMGRKLIPVLSSNPELQARYEILWQQARALLSERAEYAEANRRFQVNIQAQALNTIGQALLSATDVASLAKVMANGLPSLGVKSCYIALYADTSSEWADLIYVHGQNDCGINASLREHPIRFPSKLLCPPSMLPTDRRYTLVVEALHCDNTQLGFLVLEIESSQSYIYSALQQQISSALHTQAILGERLCAQQALTEARDQALEASRAKSTFLATMSHEIRTPMNGVLGMTELVLETPLSSEQRSMVEIIRTSATNLLTVVNDVLDYSKIEAGKLTLENGEFEPLSLIESAADIVKSKVYEKHLSLMTFVDPAIPPTLCGDSVRLRQILINLIGNAVKFTEQGEIVVRATLEKRGETYVTIRFSVKDTGIGVSPIVRQRLFQPFVQADDSMTRRYGGTGLGLSICARLVELMHGTIGVDSQEGEGSDFWFRVPLDLSIPMPDTQNLEQPPVDLHGLRVLVVDDNEASRDILMIYLSAWNSVSANVSDGESALRELRHAAETGQSYDVAILDMLMPNMSGHTLASTIKQDVLIAPTQLIAFTAFQEGEYDAITHETDFIAYLTKPINQARLLETLRNVSMPTEDHRSFTPVFTSVPVQEQCILIVEDNAINRKVATLQLQRLGFKVQTACDGREALQVLAERSYSLVLMDCQMPEIDGFEATRQVRRLEAGSAQHIPIIAMTANAMQGDKEACLLAGMDDYISKPINLPQLQAVLEKWLRTTFEAS